MLETAVASFKSWFVYPGITWEYALAGIGLALVFGAIWLLPYWPPLFRRWWLWAVLAAGAVISAVLMSFIQIPLQMLVGQALTAIWSQETLMVWLLLAGIPQVLLSGLVQEGAKMLPMLYWWQRAGSDFTPRLGMTVGAVAGAGLGIFEAVSAHCRIFAAGWTPVALQTDGFMAVSGFWERLFTVGFHISVSALVGYGLAKGKGWQYFLIGAGLHMLLNYAIVFVQKGYIGIVQVEAYVAVFAVVLTAVVLTLRVRAGNDTEAGDTETSDA